MQRLDGEATILARPDHSGGLRPDADILIEGQGGVTFGQIGRDERDHRPAREDAGGLDHERGIEALAFGDH